MQGNPTPSELITKLKVYCHDMTPQAPAAPSVGADADGSISTAPQKTADRAKILELQAKLKLRRIQKEATEAEAEKEAERRRREEGKALLEAERKRADLARLREQREAEEAAAAAKEARKLKYAAMARRTTAGSTMLVYMMVR